MLQNLLVLVQNSGDALAVAVRHVLAVFWVNQHDTHLQNPLQKSPDIGLKSYFKTGQS